MATFQDDHHLAAAIAAAAEIARTGGMFHTALAPNNSNPPSSPMFQSATEHQGRVSPSSSTVHGDDDEDDDDEDECQEEDSERRIARSRERNREHARRTRLRKKAQLEALQSKVKGLKAESEVLQQSLEECSLASILVNLSQGNLKKPNQEDKITSSLINVASTSETCSNQAEEIVQMVGGKRKRFSAPDMDDAKTSQQPLKIKMNGRWQYIGGGKSHINWKTGVYSDENGVRKQLTQQQLESLRRERNRMHAKMTRDRKKNFIATIEKTIEDLESNNARMKQVLAKVVQTHFPNDLPKQTSATVTSFSAVTPELSSKVAPPVERIPPLDHVEILPSPSKKHCQGLA